MEHLSLYLKRHSRVSFIYLATLSLSFHYFLTIYINSTVLSAYGSAREVSALYIAGALLSLLALIYATPLLQKIGTSRAFLILTMFELIAVATLASAHTAGVAFTAFFFHQAIPPLLLYILDIKLEALPHKESATGSFRGTMLTVMNVALLLCPLLVGITVINNNFTITYITADMLLLPAFLIGLFIFMKDREPAYVHSRFLKVLHRVLKDSDIRNVLIGNLLLQIFYASMVVYIALYLEHVGFAWDTLALIFTIMLLPFLLFELPVAWLADKRFGEKEFMAAGFFILALSTGTISFFAAGALGWALLLFTTRTGAALVEASSETHFFKRVGAKDAGLISMFRMTRPLSFVLGPALGSVFLTFLPLQYIFVPYAFLLLIGIFTAASITDSR